LLEPQTYNEKELLLRLAEGHEQAFSLIVNHWWQPVMNHAMTYLKSVPVAEETTLDIFEKIWHKREQLAEIESFKDWLYIVSRNELISRVRKKITSAVVDLGEFSDIEDVYFPGKRLELMDLSLVIDKATKQLTSQQRQVFELSRRDGLTHQEIAEHLGLSRQTVKGHMVNALNSLRKFLKNHGDLATYFPVVLFSTIF
jgi:RNA polymerase sigma factor (sigma-70 family)